MLFRSVSQSRYQLVSQSRYGWLDVGDPNTYLLGFRSVPRSASVKLKNSTVERVFKDPEVKFIYPMKPKELLSILGKINHNVPNRIPYVCNRDLDLFLKRLRSYYPDEKLRYYAVCRRIYPALGRFI